MEGTWTITELAGQAAAILVAGPGVPVGQVNGRVRDLPNERLIRWYTTIGLVDPPLARRGRTALYGRRHLLQLVAIKRRQSAGLSIAEIQAELAGVPDDVLRETAGLPESVPAPGPLPTTQRDRFWTTPSIQPAHPAEDAPSVVSVRAAPSASATPTAPATPSVEGVPAVVHGVRLAPGVTLLLDGGGSPGAGDLAALALAARPVLDELARRGLLTVPPIPADQPVRDLTPGSPT